MYLTDDADTKMVEDSVGTEEGTALDHRPSVSGVCVRVDRLGICVYSNKCKHRASGGALLLRGQTNIC